MPASFSNLSQELIDEVIDQVAGENANKYTLQSCSLTCRSFRNRAQSHLFRILNIVALQCPRLSKASLLKRFQKLHDIFFGRSLLATYPRQLVLAPTRYDSKWIDQYQVFHKILGYLKNLSNVLLHGFGPLHAFQDEAAFVENFWKPIIQPRLTTLHLSGIQDVPMELLMYCPQLSELKLDILTTFKPPRDGNSAFIPLRLRTLSCLWTPEAVDMLLSWKDENGVRLLNLCNLTNFRYSIHANYPWRPVIELLDKFILPAAGKSLETLSLGGKYDAGSDALVNISTTKVLKSLNCSFSLSQSLMTNEYNYSTDPISGIVGTLNTLPKKCALRHLNVDIQLDKRQINVDWHEREDWSSFDGAISKWQENVGKPIDFKIAFDLTAFDTDFEGPLQVDSWLVDYREIMEAFKVTKFPLASANPSIAFVLTYSSDIHFVD
ncbi:hypothetical protein CPB83DRAFT_906114 [Crepidotus variabilis]|uniref:F-box domain-containing protein n=1 Tax=Crepidotus variabilis TaxID=179855 RepID=A0A9P6EIU4_9AGAR|nr:hypothetical protein CPB83DRAFT_906114 [Crepidotus variabilis]